MRKSSTVPFGLHLMMDMYNCDPISLNDKKLVKRVLNELPKKLHMKALISPRVVFAQPNGKKDPGGWSGFVIIQESHISIHTFIKRRFVTVDVYSCKQFDDKSTVKYFMETFRTKDSEIYTEVRGKKYPAKDIQ